MNLHVFHADGVRPAGYAAIVERLGLRTIPNWHESFVAAGSGTHRIQKSEGIVSETYTSRYWPGDGLGEHLEFALKYDGTNLGILASIFHALDSEEIAAYIKTKQTGKYARRLWFLYELITRRRLPLENLSRGNYVELLDPQAYYTVGARHVPRQRIIDNLPGDERFCPIIRRTEELQKLEADDLLERCREVVDAYPPELLKRAINYLYTKETKSSFEIEQISPDAGRTERFVALLRLAESEDFCDKPHLIDLQNKIVDPRFAASDYRQTQNYVGESLAMNQQHVHFACPKPQDLPDLMAGLIAAHQRMRTDATHPVVHAAAVAYGFVFLHPFEDGNGRIHRFLIHNILARRNFTPQGLMFPVSAAMLRNAAEYDASLEAFSRLLMPLVEYALDDEGCMTVHNDTTLWYRFIDMTRQAEALFAFIRETIDAELPDELNFLSSHEKAKNAIQAMVDMPDRLIDLLIRFCLQNHGRLSAAKRRSHFDFLTQEEVGKLERAVAEAYDVMNS